MNDNEPRYDSSAGYQQELVDHLHGRRKHTAVVKADNSEVHAYLTRGSFSRVELLNINDTGEESPYRLEAVHPLPHSEEFSCRLVFTADWGEVFDR